MVSFILDNIRQDEKTGKYYTTFDESYRKHDCDIKPGRAKPRVEINLDYIKNNLETIVNNGISQEVFNFMQRHFKETGELISIIQSNKGKPILYTFQTKNGIKYLDKTKIYPYHPNNLNTYFTYEDTAGNIHYTKIENGTVREVIFNASTVARYQNEIVIDKNGKKIPLDWEGMFRAEADNAFEYDNLTNQDIENIYKIIDKNSETDVQPETNIQPENLPGFRQSLNILLNDEDTMKELEKKCIYKEDIDVESEGEFEEFMQSNMEAFSEVINNSNLDKQVKERLIDIKGQCK